MKQDTIMPEEIFPCWETLATEQQNALKQSIELRSFSKGEILHHGGDDCNGLFLVTNGQLRVFILSQNGKEVTLYRLFTWDICLFSASCIMKNISFEMHVEAEKDTEAYIVPAELFESILKVSLPLAEYTNQLMSARFSDVMWTMEQIIFTGFDSRLASFLIEQSVIEQSDVFLITHDEIARHMGSAREVVTKMLNYFASEGMVMLSRGKITLLDKKKLDNLVQ